ncbi:hypothetical protein QVD17_42284 [Tagetes erecta]|uniref:Uncharacterized protein n=1 Tax=Tagetes erecta TaxID=13708 RepID=A0AAD8JK83_TARER|nr:hypothetical protein QVD17_42284 [Tagetes erecta]
MSGYHFTKQCFFILDWAYNLQENNCLEDIIDGDIRSECSLQEVLLMINVALLCTNAAHTLRPSMPEALDIIEGRTNIEDWAKKSGFSTKNKALQKHLWSEVSETRPIRDEGSGKTYFQFPLTCGWLA